MLERVTSNSSVFLNNTGGAIHANNSLIKSSYSYTHKAAIPLEITQQEIDIHLEGPYYIIISKGDLVITNTTCTSFTGNKAKVGGAISLYKCNTGRCIF